ncbi:hypothetical protein R3P38DRAFT_2764045 [Favolaschia claudopus]|uniref:Uncharacterized protein n=1 Tax=Favolaschia claudopus TaxID=2862362 RepID=A0AAW0DHB6_9AGAR
MTVQKNIAGTKYVPNGLQTMVSGVLARFRDIDFNGYRHCLYGIQEGNTRAGTLRLATTQQHDVKVSDPTRPTEFTKIQNFFGSFGKEIEEHAIQQGSVRVNNGIQQDIGELAAHSSPLERKGKPRSSESGKRRIQAATNHYKARDYRASVQHFKQYRHSVKVKHYYKARIALDTTITL